MEKKSNIIELLRDYADGHLCKDDEKAVEDLIAKEPEYQQVWEKLKDSQRTDEFVLSQEMIERGYRNIQKNIATIKSGKVETGQVWKISGLSELAVILSCSDNSLTGKDYRIMVISDKDYYLKPFDLPFSDDALSFVNGIAHTHLTGNVSRERLTLLKGVLSDKTIVSILKADTDKSVLLGKEFNESFQDFYEEWYDKLNDELSLLQNEIFDEFEKSVTIINLPQKFKRIEDPSTIQYSLAAAVHEQSEALNYNGLYADNNIRVDLIVHPKNYAFKIIIIDDEIKIVDALRFINNEKRLEKVEIKLIDGVAVVNFSYDEMNEEFLLGGFEFQLEAGKYSINKKYQIRI